MQDTKTLKRTTKTSKKGQY